MKRDAGLVKSFFFILSIIFPTSSVNAQVSDSLPEEDTSYYIVYIPKHSWSVGIGYTSVPAIFTEGAFLPNSFEVQWWLKQQFYLQVGAFAQGEGVVPDNYFFNKGFGVYAGATFKLFLFPKAYLIPSLNIYYDQYPDDHGGGWSISTGPTASFEYFLGNRFSLTADLLNISYGYISTGNDFQTSTQITIHRALGLCARYNFDLKKIE